MPLCKCVSTLQKYVMHRAGAWQKFQMASTMKHSVPNLAACNILHGDSLLHDTVNFTHEGLHEPKMPLGIRSAARIILAVSKQLH